MARSHETPASRMPASRPASRRLRLASLLLPLVFLLAATAAGAAPEELARWRALALDLVNRDRAADGAAPLAPGPELDRAAQAHAEDMLRRGYYAHTSPEGDTVQDRYRAEGGSRWELVAENIARCRGCTGPITAETIRTLQTGWMRSPHHRENILRPGLARFGYGIVADPRDGLYAVQTFAGPGTPRGGDEMESASAVPETAVPARMAALLNRSRARAGAGPVEVAPALTALAAGLLPPPGTETFSLAGGDDLFGRLPEGERTRWRRLAVLAAACGGCGQEVTEADLRFFKDQWLDSPRDGGPLLDPDLDAIGVAVAADGTGRKVAVLVLGTRR